eukprot:252460-Amphidinium_carterae.1
MRRKQTQADTVLLLERLVDKVTDGMSHVQRLWARNLYNKVGYITCKTEQDLWALRTKLVASDLQLGDHKL